MRIGINSVLRTNMSIEDELLGIDEALAKLEFGIIDDGVLASHLGSRDDATFKRLRIEAKMIMDQALGIGSGMRSHNSGCSEPSPPRCYDVAVTISTI